MSMICFKVSIRGEMIDVVYNSSKTAKEFILDFTENYTNFTTFDPSIYVFKSGAKIINSPRFLNKKLCWLIKENQTVYFVRKADLNYSGGELSTVNISKNKTKEIQHTPNDIWYKYKNNGLNILSKCRNKECIAYNDDICINIGYVQNWDIFTNLDEINCPCCGNKVKPLNFAFKHCSYLIQYNIKINGDYEGRTNKGTTISDKFVMFDIKESGNADYYKLVFNVEKI